MIIFNKAYFKFQSDITPFHQQAAIFEIRGCRFKSQQPINESHAATINDTLDYITKATEFYAKEKSNSKKQTSG